MAHNENSRVKIPALVHFTRLGYEYISIKNNSQRIDEDTNIFIDIFHDAINRINCHSFSIEETIALITEIKLRLDNDDLGKAFYKIILNGINGIKIIDLEDTCGTKNTYNVVTELTYKNGSDEFRPDIIPLINGIPLFFVEVKKPNNKDGIQSEYTRINARFQNKKFKRFVNLTQLMVFSNNSEYDDNEIVPLEGAFYATSSYSRLFFSHFREEDRTIYSRIQPIDEEAEKFILLDNNLSSIKGSPEYAVNISETSPTNKIVTSLFSKERILTILKYCFAYVEKTDDNGITHLEKHIMRYPQLFATKAIEKKLTEGKKNGIIWHTQGSGKTALAYFNVRYLTDYYQKQGIIAKFYFIVDRLDLLHQAAGEFRSRGLVVDEVDSKEDFIRNIGSPSSENTTGESSITIVNIQKFSEESIARSSDYAVNVQRIYFMDEAHRSYRPTGSFLSNLISSDRNAVMIALTGTPLIGDGYNSKDVFGDYIHKYYYNGSIADGYTLRLIREGISTTYKEKLRSALAELETLKGSLKKKDFYAHEKYVTALVEYIANDFRKSRIAMNDNTIGGMIVCDSSEQAKTVFNEMQKTHYSCALILHDVADKETRENWIASFKKGSIDFLIVYNMLLTGFDAPRLKKLYLGRIIKDHSLLQALTRVNRPYKQFKYGYVVDFADIRKEFDKTNKAYFDELQSELGDAYVQYSNIFKSQEEIERDLLVIKERLFLFNTENAEIFSQQISALDDKGALIDVRKALELYKELFNIAKLFGYDDIADKFDLTKVSALYNEVNNRIALINKKELLSNAEDMSGILNLALEEIEFQFRKVSETEMVIADAFRETLIKTQREMASTFDPKDPEYITLLEELQRILGKKNIEELSSEEMTSTMTELDRIYKVAQQKNLADKMLMDKYEGDAKYMRTHKRLRETPPPITTDYTLNQILLALKHRVDSKVLANNDLLNNETYFTRDLFPLIKQELDAHQVAYTAAQIKYIGICVSNEYFTERNFA